MQYQVELARKAHKFLAAQSAKVQKQISEKIDLLETDPRPHGYKRLKGKKELYRVRTGDYRIIYTIKDTQLLVLVVQIGNRRDVYQSL